MKLERIRNLREDHDLTQTVLADHLHISQRTYSRYENDERAIPIEILIKLAAYYSTSVDYLTNRTDIKKPYPPGRQSAYSQDGKTACAPGSKASYPSGNKGAG